MKLESQKWDIYQAISIQKRLIYRKIIDECLKNARLFSRIAIDLDTLQIISLLKVLGNSDSLWDCRIWVKKKKSTVTVVSEIKTSAWL